MKRFYPLLLSLLSLSLQAQDRMREMFLALPDSVLPLLSAENRRDMADYVQNGMAGRVRNRFGENSELMVLADDYLSIDMSPKSRVEMKLLHTADSVSFVALVRTVWAPVADSEVEFYDLQGQRLHWVEFPQPAVEAFFAEAPDSLAEAARQARLSLEDLRLVEMKVQSDSPAFECVLQTGELAEKEKDAAQQLVHPLTYVWTGADFRRR